MGVDASLARDYQILHGDGIDNIPRIGDLKPKQIKDNINAYGGIKGWYRNDPEIAKKFREWQPQIALNRKLVELRADAIPDDFELYFRPSKNPHLPAQYMTYCSVRNMITKPGLL